VDARESVSERIAHLPHRIGLARQCPAREQKHGMRPAALDLVLQRRGERSAIDDAVHRREAVGAGLHGDAS
jgi:hypothetical protein